MCTIEIIDSRERDAPMGSVDLSFRLNLPPADAWINAFDSTNMSYQGPGARDFMVIQPPRVVLDAVVRWRVPHNFLDQARGYVQRRIDNANSRSPLPHITGVEEPYRAGGQWHALDLRGRDSWPEKTVCSQVEPNESWNVVDCWVEAGPRRCVRCSALTESAGLPELRAVRTAEQLWNAGV